MSTLPASITEPRFAHAPRLRAGSPSVGLPNVGEPLIPLGSRQPTVATMTRSAPPGYIVECLWSGVVEGDLPDLDRRIVARVADQLRAGAQQQIDAEVSTSQRSGIGDDAQQLHASGSGLDISGLYIRQGADGLALVNVALRHTASISALTTQAQTPSAACRRADVRP